MKLNIMPSLKRQGLMLFASSWKNMGYAKVTFLKLEARV